MARPKLQFSLLTLLIVTTLVAVACVVVPPVVQLFDIEKEKQFFIAMTMYSPILAILWWCFKDVFKDFGIGGRRHQTHVARQLPEKLELPDSPPDEEPRRPRKKRKIRPASWWHPLGGWSKQ